jgi:chitinase
VLQTCDSKVKTDTTLGLFAVDGFESLSDAQVAVGTWAKGACVDVSGTSEQADLEILTSAAGDTTVARSITSRFNPRADGDCTFIEVVSGDRCGSLSSKCGISAADFYKYNPASDLCSTLQVGQKVCCSAGNLPTNKPNPYENGTCYTYTVVSGDTCFAIGKSFDITADFIESVNTGTWGWSGCSRMQPNDRICLSTGNIPMPAPNPDAACGPTVVGTSLSLPFTGADLAEQTSAT